MVTIQDVRYRYEELKKAIELRYMHEILPVLDKVKALDEVWRKNLKELDKLRHKRNELAKKIGKLKRGGQDISKLVEEAKNLELIINSYESKVKELEQEVKELLLLIPNFVDEEVPIGYDDTFNKPIEHFGKIKVRETHLKEIKPYLENHYIPYEVKKEEDVLNYWEILERANLVDTEKTSKIAGSRFYTERNCLVFLEFALNLYAIDFYRKKGFKEVIIPPYFLRKSVEEKITYFSAFEDTIFKIEGEDLVLIPTSEHAILALYSNTTFRKKELPLRILAFSHAFRKEATSLTKDIKGIFRVKQFSKVELHSMVEEGEDKKELKFLKEVFSEFIKSLEIPYRIVINSSGDMDRRAKLQMDLEGWFPGQGKYRELGSLATMGYWVSSKLGIRYLSENEKKFVNNLYSTGLATQRTICALLENHYGDGVVELPKVLHKYLPDDCKIIEVK